MEKVTTDIHSIINRSTLKKAWHSIGTGHHHGINIPLFSIHSKNSCGIGEFLDLKLLIDFCVLTSMNIIQLLPLNDTGFETSPYNAISSQALNPIYLSLHSLPFIKSDSFLQEELQSFKKYSYLQKIAYNAVLSAKLDFLYKYYQKYFKNFSSLPIYKDFLIKNKWVYDYALFKCLKEDYSHKGWFSWRKEDQEMTHSYKKKLLTKKNERINYFIFIQYLSFTQLEEIKRYATKNNILIKGDIPILISPESLDVWQGRRNFNLDYSAGAPPDMFNPEGQAWGFPIYNWHHMEESNYCFWQDRLKTASNLYHLYRIDHIIGFYRIYSIPRNSSALKGQYIPSDPNLAKIQGEKILKKLTSFTDMLPIGEDLGLDVEYIRESLADHAIAGTKIPRWERNHLGDNSFIHYKDYHQLTLTTVSTHDSETLTQWWKNNPQEARDFSDAMELDYTRFLTPSLRYKMLYDSHHSNSLFHINLLSEYLALYDDLIWDNPDDERINLPGTILPSNWCYKTRPSLEMLLSHESLKNSIKSMLKK